MIKSLLALTILVLSFSSFAQSSCAWKSSQKLADICQTVKEKLSQKCDTSAVRGPVSEMKTLRSIRDGLTALGYQIDSHEYDKLEKVLRNISREEFSYNLRRARASICTQQNRLMKWFDRKVVY